MTMDTTPLFCIVGLCNPGAKYESTRHNAGAWFVQEILRQYQVSLTVEKKFFGECAKIQLSSGETFWLLLPNTFMNRSGQSVSAFAKFHKLKPNQFLVVHDELDLPPGTVKIKQDGGHGGHNGLRDIIKSLGNQRTFNRLRIGIGHPGHSDDVINYVLKAPSKSERAVIDDAIYYSLRELELMIKGQWQLAMNKLHSIKPSAN